MTTSSVFASYKWKRLGMWTCSFECCRHDMFYYIDTYIYIHILFFWAGERPMLRLIPGAKSWNLCCWTAAAPQAWPCFWSLCKGRWLWLKAGIEQLLTRLWVVKPPNSCCLNPTQIPKSIPHLDSQHQNFSKHFPKIISQKTSQLPKFTTPIWTIRPPPSKAIRRRSGRRGRCTGHRPGWWPPTCGAPWWAPWNGWSRSRLWWCLGGWEGGEKVDFLGFPMWAPQ